METQQTKAYRGVIFDLDGTLLNTLADLGNSANLVLEEYGKPTHGPEDYRKFVGAGLMNLMHRCFPADTPDEDFDAILARMLYYYDLHYMDETVPYPGMTDLLRQLDAAGLCLAVNSNKRESYTRNLVARWFPDVPFTAVLGEGGAFPKKPDPAAAQYICRLCGLAPEEVLYVGDSAVDADTGRAAGMDVAGCLWGFRGEEELRAHGARCVVGTAEALARVCLGTGVGH